MHAADAKTDLALITGLGGPLDDVPSSIHSGDQLLTVEGGAGDGGPACRQVHLRRIGGQIEGIERMVEQERYCIGVLTQISAVQGALDRVALGLLDDHARNCIVDAEGSERPQRAEELMGAVGRLLRSRSATSCANPFPPPPSSRSCSREFDPSAGSLLHLLQLV